MCTRPIIFDYVVNRKDAPCKKHFAYNYQKDLNILIDNRDGVPFILAPSSLLSTYTQTRVMREADDDDQPFLELFTKTLVQRESDDESLEELFEYLSTAMIGTENF